MMQVVDISSLMHSGLNAEDILKSAYIIQESRRLDHSLFFIDQSKLSEHDFQIAIKTLEENGITPFVANKPLYHFIDAIQKDATDNDFGPVEFVSQDLIAISRLNKSTSIWDITSNKRYSTEQFSEELLEFPHNRLGLYALITQDNYHNIHTGVEVGPSQAVKLIKGHASLKELIQSQSIPSNLAAIVDGIKRAGKSIAGQMRLEYDEIPLERYARPFSVTNAILQEAKGQRVEADSRPANFVPVHTPLAIIEAIKEIEEANATLYLDIQPTLVALRCNQKNYIISQNDGMPFDTILNTCKSLFENNQISKCAFSAKSVHRAALESGISLVALKDDVEMAEYTLNNLSGQKPLEELTEKYFFESPHPMPPLDRVAASLESVERLHLKQISQMDETEIKFYRSVEMPMTKILASMEHKGAYVNSGKLKILENQIKSEIAEQVSIVRQYSPTPININSSSEVSKLIYQHLKLEGKGKSTAKEVLEALLEKTGHPVIPAILKYRELEKINSSYITSLPKLINPKTNRIHATYNQNKVVTGRLSCQNPGLQNIPAKTKVGKKVKQAFEGEGSRKLVAGDYSQIELKVLAHLSQEPALIDAFKNGLDIHKNTAAKVFDVPYEEVSGEQRAWAKQINFGLIYGMTKYGLASKLKVHPNEAQGFIDLYFQKLPKVREYTDRLKESALKYGYVKTLTGRKVYIDKIHSSNPREVEAALRAATNAPMQGSASDIIKIATIKLFHEMQSQEIDGFIFMQVHDELIAECSPESADKLAKLMEDTMKNAVKLRVSLETEVAIGDNWENAHPIEKPQPKMKEETSLEP